MKDASRRMIMLSRSLSLRALTGTAAAVALVAGLPAAAQPAQEGMIAFTSERFAVQLAVMQPDGRAQRVLQRHPSLNYQPVRSPDGSRLAFVSSRAGNTDVWVAPTTGGKPMRLTTTPSAEYDPAWSPDGARLAF